MTAAGQIVPGVLSGIYRRAMRQAAMLVHDIDVARHAGAVVPGDQGLRPLVLAQAMKWRDRARAAATGGMAPCRFCGATITSADILGDGDYGDDAPWQMTCPNCGARGPRDETPEGAGRRWNHPNQGRRA